MDLGGHFPFCYPRYFTFHLFEKKRPSVAPDQNVFRGFLYIEERLSEETVFSDSFNQDINATFRRMSDGIRVNPKTARSPNFITPGGERARGK